MVEDELISKNKLLMYLADLGLTYAPVYGQGEAEKYNFIKELSRIFEQWDGETVSKTESVECEDCISREVACQKMMEMYKEDCEMYGVEIPECFDGHRAVRALMELPSVTPKI